MQFLRSTQKFVQSSSCFVHGARTVLEIDSDCVLECTLSRNSFDFKMHCNLLWPSLKAFPSITCDPVRNTNYAKLRNCLKVRKFQNEFMKSSFLPTYEPNNVRISALYCAKQQDRNPYNFWFIVGRNDDFINSF